MSEVRVPSSLARPASVTHQHLLAIVSTECARRGSNGRTVRVLDVGCGDGRLIAYLMENLALLNPALRFELFGMDVVEPGVQLTGFLAGTRRPLSDRFPA